MNITGGTNLSLYEVQEAADIVASASDPEVNMIFGSVINENLKDEIVVTVIATGFSESEVTETRPLRTGYGVVNTKTTVGIKREKREEVAQEYVQRTPQQVEDALDIPAFLRNRNRRR